MLFWGGMYLHAHVSLQSCADTCMHDHTAHKHLQACANIRTYIYIHTYVHMHLQVYKYTYINTHTHTSVHAFVHAYMYTPICAYICTYIYTHFHATYVDAQTLVDSAASSQEPRSRTKLKLLCEECGEERSWPWGKLLWGFQFMSKG